MKLRVAFCLYRFFPFGGRERNCEDTARLTADHGHEVHVFTRRWDGRKPSELTIHELGELGWTNIGRDTNFIRRVRSRLHRGSFDVVVGFDLVPGVDLFYSADPCLALSPRAQSLFSRLTRRYRRRLAWERELFAPRGTTELLVLTEQQRDDYRAAYGTPEDRIRVLPANLEDAPLRRREEGAEALAPLGIKDSHFVLLLVGSDYRRKGLDRAIDALAELPPHTRLVVVGDDEPGPWAKQVRRLGVEGRVVFAGPREDVSLFHARADVLAHPARKETAGVVVLEALHHGVPVVVSEACGFATHIAKSGAGHVLPLPFQHATFVERLRTLVESPAVHRRLGERGQAYARRGDLYGRHEAIVARIEELGHAKAPPEESPGEAAGLP